MVQACNPGVSEALAGGSEVQGQSRLQGETSPQKKGKKIKKKLAAVCFGCDLEGHCP